MHLPMHRQARRRRHLTIVKTPLRPLPANSMSRLPTPRTRTIGGRERPSGRVLCPGDLAGKPNAKAVSPKGADRQLARPADPFDPTESLRHSAANLRELLNRFGNLGLAAAANNASSALGLLER